MFFRVIRRLTSLRNGNFLPSSYKVIFSLSFFSKPTLRHLNLFQLVSKFPKSVPRLLTKVVSFFLIFLLFNPPRFSVTDVLPPVFLSCPSDIRTNVGVNSSVLVNWTIPVALDNSNMAPQISVSPLGVAPPYSFYNNTNVVYTAKDPSGNERKCSFRVLLEGA